MSRRGPRILRALAPPARGRHPCLALLACWAGRVCACRRLRAHPPLRRPAGRGAAILAGLPARRAPGDVRAARPPRRLPGDAGGEPALPGRRDRAAAGDPGRTARRRWRQPLGAAGPAAARSPPPRPAAASSPASASTPAAAPSSRSMAAWAASPYRAIGVYIGGANRGCSQPNLTASWVGAQTAAGWHLIPTYVGLQAPTSSCSSCAKLSASQATAQGDEAAVDAVAEAGTRGDRPRQPDLLRHGVLLAHLQRHRRHPRLPRGLDREAARARLRLRRLQQRRLRDRRPRRRSSAAATSCPTTSGSPTGTARPTTSDPYVPASGWTQHQRIHQYRGGHDETYGGVTINIDNNYVDGATVGTAAPPAASEDPVGYARPGRLARARARCGSRAGPSTRARPTEPLAIRAYVGGGPGAPGAVAYELGAVATQARPDVGAKYPRGGRRTTASTSASRP